MDRLVDEASDVFFNVNLNTLNSLPSGGELLSPFLDQMAKALPEIGHMVTQDSGEIGLEGDKASGAYGWITIESRRLCSGYVNPPSLDKASRQHETMLGMAPLLLPLAVVGCEALDVMYGFDFTYAGNHDELVAEALGLGPSLGALLDLPGRRVIHFEPSVTLGLDADLGLQCRLAVETRSNAVQVRTGTYPEEQFSVYFSVRQFWGLGPELGLVDAYRRQRTIAEEILREKILPRVVRPLALAITNAS